MKYVQILECSSDLGSCCSDGVLVGIIDIVRKVMDLLQVLIPILLLTMLIVQLLKLVVNPDEKNGIKMIKNRILAAVIVFVLPTILNTVINMLPENEKFQMSACWKTAQNISEIQKASESQYISTDDGQRKYLISAEVKNSNSSNSISTGSVSSGNGSVAGKKIVDYALSFVGQKYIYGGSWNGEEPYTPTDCSGFVQGVFRHNGINLQRTTTAQWQDRSKYTLVSTGDIRAGDLAMYRGHVAIFTGNGNQIVHAANSKSGIIVTPNYRNGASNFLGVMRINGVN